MSWLGELWTTVKSLFSANPVGTAVMSCDKALSETAAQSLFNRLRAHTEIPFNYPPDCCYARASAMVDLIAKEGISSKKVWTYGVLVPLNGDGTPVHFPPSPAGEQVIWGYHVAPTIKVLGTDGVCRDMVMDPSLSDRPLTIAQWNTIMTGSGSDIQETIQTEPDIFVRGANGKLFRETNQFDRNTAFANHIRKRDGAHFP